MPSRTLNYLVSAAVLFLAGCAVVSRINIRAEGKNLRVPVSGIAVIKGELVNIHINRQTEFYLFREGVKKNDVDGKDSFMGQGQEIPGGSEKTISQGITGEIKSNPEMEESVSP